MAGKHHRFTRAVKIVKNVALTETWSLTFPGEPSARGGVRSLPPDTHTPRPLSCRRCFLFAVVTLKQG